MKVDLNSDLGEGAGHDDESNEHEVVEEDGSQYRRNERVA